MYGSLAAHLQSGAQRGGPRTTARERRALAFLGAVCDAVGDTVVDITSRPAASPRASRSRFAATPVIESYGG